MNLIGQLEALLAAQDGASSLKPTHFYHPMHSALPITVLYPGGSSGADATEVATQIRQQLHFRLALPDDRPLFRAVNGWDLHGVAAAANKRLRDPHSTLPPSKVSGGEQFIVKGSYDYHHYMQVVLG